MSGFHAENIPKEMRDLPQWVCFRKYAENPGDHPKKMMISPETGGAARSDDPSTWSNFFIASSLMARKRMDGLAFALTQGIVFIDLDNAVLEGGVSNAAREILHALPKTYAETSCSGKGIHVFCKGTLDEASLKRNDKLGIEMYQSKRFACMSCLNEIIEPDPSKPHTFDDRQPNVTVFYGRDRGEKGQEAQKVKLEDIESDGSWIEWCYVFGKDGKWRYFECGHLKEGLKDLKEGLDEEYKRLGFPRPEGYYGFFTQGDIAKRRADWQKIKVVAMQ